MFDDMYPLNVFFKVFQFQCLNLKRNQILLRYRRVEGSDVRNKCHRLSASPTPEFFFSPHFGVLIRRKNPDTDGMCFRICRSEKSRHPYTGGISTYTTSVFFKAYKEKAEAPVAATVMINAKGMS